MARGAEGEHALLGARSFLVASRPAEGGIEAAGIERLAERCRLHHVGIDRRRVVEWIDIASEPVMVGMDDEVESELARGAIAEGDHLAEFPCGVDMEQRERRLGRPERLA